MQNLFALWVCTCSFSVLFIKGPESDGVKHSDRKMSVSGAGFAPLDYEPVVRADDGNFPREQIRESLDTLGVAVIRQVLSEFEATGIYEDIDKMMGQTLPYGAHGSGLIGLGFPLCKRIMELRMNLDILKIFQDVYMDPASDAPEVKFEERKRVPFGFKVLQTPAAETLATLLCSNVYISKEELERLGFTSFAHDACVHVTTEGVARYFVLESRMLMSMDRFAYLPDASHDRPRKRRKVSTKKSMGPWHRQHMAISNGGLNMHVDVGEGEGRKIEDKLRAQFGRPCIQGQLVLREVKMGGPTLIVKPGAYTKTLPDYEVCLQKKRKDDYVPWDEQGYQMSAGQVRAVYNLKPGDLVLWFSGTPHGNQHGNQDGRCVAFLAALPKSINTPETNKKLQKQKLLAAASGSTTTHWATPIKFEHGGRHFSHKPGGLEPLYHDAFKKMKEDFVGAGRNDEFEKEIENMLLTRYGPALVESMHMFL